MKAPLASTKASSPTWFASLLPAASPLWFTRMCRTSFWDQVNDDTWLQGHTDTLVPFIWLRLNFQHSAGWWFFLIQTLFYWNVKVLLHTPKDLLQWGTNTCVSQFKFSCFLTTNCNTFNLLSISLWLDETITYCGYIKLSMWYFKAAKQALIVWVL